MKHTLYPFLVLFILTVSCGKLSEKDNSMTSDEYKKLGMPDDTRIWSYEDYKYVCELLDDIKNAKPLALPRKNSERSGMYFDRLVNPDNLDFVFDETLALRERAYEIRPYVGICKYLIVTYTDQHTIEQYYHRELIDLYMFGVTITQYMLDIGSQINESVDERDLTMQSQFFLVQNMYITMVEYVLEKQEKHVQFEPDDLKKLSNFVFNSLMINKDWIEADAAENVKNQLKKVINTSTSDHVIKKYSLLIDEL